ncbi:MAG: hypothetical protein CMI06_07410 [Oceanospirillaceae bacterium]|nr:hypothetical protein [Oceanospirillaceae bacterium]
MTVASTDAFSFIQEITDHVRSFNDPVLEKSSGLGWVLCSEMPYGNFKSIITENDASEIDRVLTDYYLDKIRIITDKCVASCADISPYIKGLMEDFSLCIEEKRYHICLPAGFALIEAILIPSNNYERQKIRYFNALKAKSLDDSLTLKVIPYRSMMYFIAETFQQTDFNLSDPKKLNRHWSQHGRYTSDPEEKFVFQLLGAIDIALYLYMDMTESVS